MLLLSYLRTFLTASLVAVAIVACDGSSGDGVAQALEDEDASSAEERIVSAGFSSTELEILTVMFLEKTDGNPHGTHIPVSTIPSSGELMINVIFSRRPASVRFLVVDIDGIEISQIIPDDQANLYDESYYYGYFNVPSDDFRIRVEGLTANGTFSYDIPKIYSS